MYIYIPLAAPPLHSDQVKKGSHSVGFTAVQRIRFQRGAATRLCLRLAPGTRAIAGERTQLQVRIITTYIYMCVCVCIYICIYINIYVCIYIHTLGLTLTLEVGPEMPNM